MVKSLGGSVQPNPQCCMVCNPAIFTEDSRLGIVDAKLTVARKKRRVAVRRVSDLQLQVLESSLKAERSNFISEHPNLSILGVQMVCPDEMIKNICAGVKFISNISDMDNFCIRQELKQRFYTVIMLVAN